MDADFEESRGRVTDPCESVPSVVPTFSTRMETNVRISANGVEQLEDVLGENTGKLPASPVFET